MKIIFLLPGGGGGGSHSVVQESLGLRRLGATVGIAVKAASLPTFEQTYPELGTEGVKIGGFTDEQTLARMIDGYDLAIATSALSVQTLVAARLELGQRAPAAGYYIQDYEPLFYARGTEDWARAYASYMALPEGLLFAKTDWLRNIVFLNHGRSVAKVAPSLDHGVYYPELRAERPRIVISAMVRPKTPRRAPRRTARILEKLASAFPDAVHLIAFGGSPEDLRASGIRWSDHVDDRGVLTRQEVATVLRASDIFLDLSDYQAFGRTALEAMACGCVPVVPVLGGAREFAVPLDNAFMVDTRSDEAILAAVRIFLESSAGERRLLRRAAIMTAQNYSIQRAALSEQQLFADFIGCELS